MKKGIKEFSKKIGLYKPENERTKTQKVIRDVAFFGVVIYAAVITFLYIDAESQVVELDCGAYSAANQVAFNK